MWGLRRDKWGGKKRLQKQQGKRAFSARTGGRRLLVEPLESRLLAAADFGTVCVSNDNACDSPATAQWLGFLDLQSDQRVVLNSTLYKSGTGTDVDWYTFRLAQPRGVALNVASFGAGYALLQNDALTVVPDPTKMAGGWQQYYVAVWGRMPSGLESYSLSLQAYCTPAELKVGASSVTGTVERECGDRSIPVSLSVYGGARFNPHARKWLLIHGRNDSQAGMIEIAQAIAAARPGDQVLLLNWEQGARDNTVSPLAGANWIGHVGAWAARALTAVGIRPENLQIVGHSWGAYVGAATAEQMAAASGGRAKVAALVALDPAQDFDLFIQEFLTPLSGLPDLLNRFDPRTIDFSRYAQNSWALHTSICGSGPLAQTARDSFEVVIPGVDSLWDKLINGKTAHSLVKDLFVDLVRHDAPLESGLYGRFNLDRLVLGSSVPWQRDAGSGLGKYEAQIMVKGNKAAAGEQPWQPVSLQYIGRDAGRAVRETDQRISPDLAGNAAKPGKAVDLSAVFQPGYTITAPGWLGTSNPRDCFSFVVPVGQVWSPRFDFSSSAAGSSLQVLDANGKRARGTTKLSANDGSRTFTLSAGTYYLQVENNNSKDTTYELVVSVPRVWHLL